MAKQNKDWKALNIKLDRTVYEQLVLCQDLRQLKYLFF